MAGMEALWDLGPPPGGYSFDPALTALPPGFQGLPADVINRAAKSGFQLPADAVNEAAKGGFGLPPKETVHGKSNGAWFRADNPQNYGPGLAPLDFGNYGQPQLPQADQTQAKNPYLGGLLGNADILEGIAYRNRQAASQPHMAENQTLLYGSPLTYSEPVPGQQFDYRGNLLNQGMNPSRQSFANLYDRSMVARGQMAPGEMGSLQPYGQDYMAPPDVSPAEQSQRMQNAFDFMRDLHLSMNPATAPLYAAGTAAHLASKVPGQLGEGDYRAAGLSAGGAALAAFGAVPGAGAARSAARKTVSESPVAWMDAPPGLSRDQALELGGRVKLDAQGQPITVPTIQNMGNMTYTYHTPQWEIPAASMGTPSPGLIGGPLAPDIPSARTMEPRPPLGRSVGMTPAEGSELSKQIEGFQKNVQFDRKGNQIIPQGQPETVAGMFIGPGAPGNPRNPVMETIRRRDKLTADAQRTIEDPAALRRRLSEIDSNYQEEMLQHHLGAGANAASAPPAKGTPDTVLGMFLGPGAHPLSDRLQKAGQEMEAAGMKPGEIWRRTAALSQEQGTGGPGGLMGAFKAPDKTWRTEVDDSQASVNTRDRPQTLGEALQHPTLYKYAPGLESTGVGYNVQPRYSGAFTPGPGSDPGFINVTPEGTSIPHEAQHALQHYSGVEGGWNPQAAVPRGNPKIEDLLQAQTQAQYNKYPEFGKKVAEKSALGMMGRLVYKRSAGEIEANTAANRFSMTPAQRIAMPPFEQWPVPAGSQLTGLRNLGPAAALKKPPPEEFPAVRKQALDTRHGMAQNLPVEEYKNSLRALAVNPTVDAPVRRYLWELHNYAFRPVAQGGDFANGTLQAYMNLTGGKMGKYVSMDDLRTEYANVEKQRASMNLSKTGTEHYVKGDMDALKRHLYNYGREIGEKFDEVPTKAAPWLIYPDRNAVAFSPYLPKISGN